MIDDCWNTIGVHGDASCARLREYVHCRNCPVFSGAAKDMLDVELPAGYRSDRTGHISQARVEADTGTHSVVVFRVDAHHMALPTALFKEIVDVRPIHSMPQRRGGAVLGIANVRGQLVVCVSLSRMLGFDKALERLPKANGSLEARLLVLEHERELIVCPVDEVFGVHRFHRRELLEVPSTISRSTAAYTTAILPREKKSVALLDERLLFYSFERSLALTAI